MKHVSCFAITCLTLRLIIANVSDLQAGWHWQNPYPQPHELNDFFFIDANQGWAVGNYGTMLYSTDGGNTWSQQTSGTTTRFAGIDFVDTNHGWAVGIYGEIVHTTDGGATWAPQNSGTGELLHAVDFIDRYNGWVTGRSSTILCTTDGGNTWLPQLTRTWYDISSVCFIDGNVGWVSGDYGAIMHTEDGGGILSVQPDIKLPPQNFRLFQNYPNPFNPTTCIGFAIPKTTKVELSIYDMLGRKVATPMDKWLPAGRHEVEWNAASYSSGIYFYELTAGKYRAVQRMLLIK